MAGRPRMLDDECQRSPRRCMAEWPPILAVAKGRQSLLPRQEEDVVWSCWAVRDRGPGGQSPEPITDQGKRCADGEELVVLTDRIGPFRAQPVPRSSRSRSCRRPGDGTARARSLQRHSGGR